MIIHKNITFLGLRSIFYNPKVTQVHLWCTCFAPVLHLPTFFCDYQLYSNWCKFWYQLINKVVINTTVYSLSILCAPVCTSVHLFAPVCTCLTWFCTLKSKILLVYNDGEFSIDTSYDSYLLTPTFTCWHLLASVCTCLHLF